MTAVMHPIEISCHHAAVVVLVVTFALVTILIVWRCHLYTVLSFSIAIACQYTKSKCLGKLAHKASDITCC